MSWETTLSQQQQKHLEELRAFSDSIDLDARADEWEKAGSIPREFAGELASAGLLSVFVPESHGGRGWDQVSFGLLCECFGHASFSLASLVTVHSMVLEALTQWGTDDQKDCWLRALASGEMTGAFCLTEPHIGSDAANIQTEAVRHGDHYVISGSKKWISNGVTADLYLVIAQCESKPVALLVPRDTRGLRAEPMSGLLGFRAANIAEVFFDECEVPASQMIGSEGVGFSHVAGRSLDLGRFCVAFGCLGLIEACTESSIEYSRKRKQFGVQLAKHQLILEMLSNMITASKSTRHLCLHAARLRENGDPESIVETTTAKYYASRMSTMVASDAVQVHGAMGCIDQLPVERHYRDARITEIIEGSNQMQQMMIARNGSMAYRRRKRKKSQGSHA